MQLSRDAYSLPHVFTSCWHHWTANSSLEDIAAHAAMVKGQMEVAVFGAYADNHVPRIVYHIGMMLSCTSCNSSRKGSEKSKEETAPMLITLQRTPFATNVLNEVGHGHGTVPCNLTELMKKKKLSWELALQVFQKEVENQLGKTIKSLRSDRGGEYMSQEFLDHLKEHGIIAHRTPPYTPQNNGVSERRNRTLLDMVRSMMSQTTLPKSFWDYALETAARILNMVPSKKVDKTPYEIWHGQAPKLSYLRVWGCEAFVKHDTLTKPDKLDPRSFKCIFVGYPKETMGYSFYSPSENKVFVARNAEFFESKLLDLKASGSVEDLELIQEEDTNPPSLNKLALNHEDG
ncbi:retrotransposon protein, putative, ty1-copia subclass [Tanacetum coccineum]